MILSLADYVIITVYFIVIVAIGAVSFHFTKTKEDYLVVGRRLSFPLFFGCMAALALGGGSTVGSAELGYRYGFGGIWLNASIGLGLILTGILITSKLSKLRILSVNEVVEGSYGSIARLFSTVLTLIYTVTLSVVQVIAIGTIINGVLGLDSTWSMVAGGGIVIAYTLAGGMWSVTMTDIVQFAVKTVGILILAPIFCLSAAGGWSSAVAQLPANFLSIGNMGFDKSFAYLLLYVPGLIIGQDIWQRIFTAKKRKGIKNGRDLRWPVFYRLCLCYSNYWHERSGALAKYGRTSKCLCHWGNRFFTCRHSWSCTSCSYGCYHVGIKRNHSCCFYYCLQRFILPPYRARQNNKSSASQAQKTFRGHPHASILGLNWSYCHDLRLMD